jgi:TonB-dependent SusC/RagA subfamily outer membrane receptor
LARSGPSRSASQYIEQSFSVSGTVNLPNGQPVRKGNLLLMVTNHDGLLANPQTDSLGRFLLDGLDYPDTIKLVVQARTEKDRKRLNIRMDERTYLPLAPRGFPARSFLAADYLANRRQQTQADLSFNGLADQVLREVQVKGKRIKEELASDGRYRLHSQADFVLSAKDNDFTSMAPSGNILQALQGRVAGLQIMPDGAGGFTAQVRGITSISGSNAPLLLIDGTPMTDLTSANMISPGDVESVEILKGASAAIYGMQAGGGVIAIYTKRGGGSTANLPREGIINYEVMGYTKGREFYSPDYAKAPPKTLKPDLRSTIYWNGQLKTGPDGKATVWFYTADTPGRYRLVADGLSASGLPGCTIQYLEVGKD